MLDPVVSVFTRIFQAIGRFIGLAVSVWSNLLCAPAGLDAG